MKLFVALIVAGASAVLFPVAFSPKVVAKPVFQGAAARRKSEQVRVASALGALRRGDSSKLAEVRNVIAHLRPGDPSRVEFASLLAERGDRDVAFNILRTKVRFEERSVPKDEELALYASLAKKLGHAEEAAWARARMGAEGHYRVWMEGSMLMLEQAKHALSGSPGAYENQVNQQMDAGLRLYPQYRDRIEVVRREMLGASSSPQRVKP